MMKLIRRVLSVASCKLTNNALLSKYSHNGHYVDCYRTRLDQFISHEQFVWAFYTTPVFKLERWILRWTVSKPSVDTEVTQLSKGEIDNFAVWRVEERAKNQLMLTDFQDRTRSWLMTVSDNQKDTAITDLYFGSAVIAVKNRQTDEVSIGFVFRSLLGFHKFYSVVLLYAARVRLKRQLPKRPLDQT